MSVCLDTEGLEEAMRPGMNLTRGRSTKFCMVRENGDYADLYYCNVYHNCHGGFDTIQYCTHGLVSDERQMTGRCSLFFRFGVKKQKHLVDAIGH